jgi:two-component system sensor kinase FixL
MAAALAHELNQPLTAVANYLYAAQRLLDAPEPDLSRTREAVERAAGQTLRAGEIIRRLRSFVARGQVQRQAEGVGKLIEEASALALVGAKEHNIHVTLQVTPDLPNVFVERVQIQQVLLNLLRNAVEVLEDQTRRDLVVLAQMDAAGVRISIGDSGPGVPAEIAAHLFQPFVTSKADGMGLGLSICRTIIEAHGGRLWMEPRDEGGTFFHFTVPVV